MFSVRYELRMTTGRKQMYNGTRAPGSFLSVKRFGALFDNKVLFKNNRPIVFSIVLKINRIAKYRENNKSIALKQYFISYIFFQNRSLKRKILEPGSYFALFCTQ